jgi:hypothetical protein
MSTVSVQEWQYLFSRNLQYNFNSGWEPDVQTSTTHTNTHTTHTHTHTHTDASYLIFSVVPSRSTGQREPIVAFP